MIPRVIVWRGAFRPLPLAYAGLTVLLLAYLVSLVMRAGAAPSVVVDGWLVAGFEATASSLILCRGLRLAKHRTVPIMFGLAGLSWSIGDLVLTLQSSAGGTAPTPSVADAFYAGFYLLAYVALITLIRHRVHNLSAAMWLDGIAAGLGAAAICACFLLNGLVLITGGDPAAVATDLLYPIGDLLLLALVVAGSCMIPGGGGKQWVLLGVACTINAAGDLANLLSTSGSSWVLGLVNAAAWPTSILIISIALWRPARGASPGLSHQPAAMLLPTLGAIAGFAILVVGSFTPISHAALALAAATLVVVGTRSWLSLRHLRSLTHKRHGQAITDELTGLGNRRQLFYTLNDYFADLADPSTPRASLGLLYIDLDHFKEINDSFGHSAGDELLRQLGPRLQGSLRAGDSLLRIGGDEFAVIIVDAEPEYARAVAERLVGTLAEPFTVGGVLLRVGASIGIAVAPSDAADSAALLACADIAMYRAKLSGITHHVYRAEVDDSGNRLRLADELHTALDEHQLVLHYQPQLELRSGEVRAVEALVRWAHPSRGLVPPLDFLPLAEEAGLMPRLTEWVVGEALAQCAEWRAAGRPLSMSINASVSNLLDDGFIPGLRAALEAHGLPADALTIEITETTIIRDFAACRHVVGRLREEGIGVSIDDFGAGFTSLAYLGGMPVTELKLDRTFITAMAGPTDGRDLTLVRGTIELGHTLGLAVVAEGVEDAVILELLTSSGCDLAQGYLISRPVPAAELTPLLDARHPRPRLRAVV